MAGGLPVETLLISIDSYMGDQMGYGSLQDFYAAHFNETSTAIAAADLSVTSVYFGRSVCSSNSIYAPGITIFRIANFALGIVLRSKHPTVAAGNHIYGYLPFKEYTIVSNIRANVMQKIANLPWSAYLGMHSTLKQLPL